MSHPRALSRPLLAALVLALVVAVPAAAVDPADTSARAASSCSSSARDLGLDWHVADAPFRWSANVAGRPSDLGRSATFAAMRRAMRNIVQVKNPCGLRDVVRGPSARFMGATGRVAQIPGGECHVGDGHSVVSFGALPSGIVARACHRLADGSEHQLAESDVKLNSRVRWATSLDDCSSAYLVEDILTHEFGHVFGLDHVGDRSQTMYRMSRTCSNARATLGHGDWLGLKVLYD